MSGRNVLFQLLTVSTIGINASDLLPSILSTHGSRNDQREGGREGGKHDGGRQTERERDSIVSNMCGEIHTHTHNTHTHENESEREVWHGFALRTRSELGGHRLAVIKIAERSDRRKHG